MEAKELAALTLEVLTMQKNYFALRKAGSASAGTVLNHCRAKERELKAVCERLLTPESEQPSLFDEPKKQTT